MQIVKTVDAIRAHSRHRRCAGKRVALVPTMGALHDGHMALVDRALELADDVIVSIFVNPTQFGPGEDFDRYPRPTDGDLELLGARNVAAVFMPTSDEMYPFGTAAEIALSVGSLADHLCGKHRPGHFEGVVQIVSKLFIATEPDVAVFGLKDAQQFVIIKTLVNALGFGIEVVGMETVRNEDGLAMSSRNRYLHEGHRRQAVVLSRALQAASRLITEREQARDALVTAMRHELALAPDFEHQYAEVVDGRSLQPIDHIAPGQDLLLAVAGYFDRTRLIDSAFVTAPGSSR
jgi:pantoate--beta-alanine ligase